MSKTKAPKGASTPAVQPPAETPKEQPAPAEGGVKARGPVEEVIAKRARQLAKKIQRFKEYSTKPIESLNADQKVAVQSLPALEGAFNELQELIKPGGVVENAELIEAGRLRDLQKDSEAQRSAADTSSVVDFQDKLIPRLGLFIRLHALLHPARPSDHQHLTFGHLDLPSHLQDEVQATDVLRAGRMWDDLTRGGDEAKVVISGLVEGPKGDDEENDHIHHLLDLLSQPPAETSFPPTHPSSPTPQDTLNIQTSVDGDYPAEHPTEVIPPASAIASRRESVIETNGGGGGFLNFLQEDELHGSPAAHKETLGEDDYEVVPMLEAHQTSGLQPPFEEAPAAQAQGSGNTSFNWADDHDEEHHAPAVEAGAKTEAVEQPVEEHAADVAEAAQVEEAGPIAAQSAASAASAPTATGTAAGPSKAAPNGPQTSPARTQGQRGGRGGRAPPPPAPKRETTVVDEDGFEMKVRSRPVVPTRGSGRGRGGQGGGDRRGSGVGGGRGGGRGGGASRGAPRSGPNGQHNGGHVNGDPPRANGTGQNPQRPTHASQHSHSGKPKNANAPKQAPPAAATASAPAA